MKNAVFWGIMPCGSCNNQCCVLQLLVTANIPSSLILVTLMMEAIRSSEMSVITRVTWRNTPEDGIRQN
jgi:hypothetical protein